MNPSIRVGSKKWYTVPLSIISHVLIFAAIVIIPLMATDVLPTPPSMMAFVAGAPPLVFQVGAVAVPLSPRQEWHELQSVLPETLVIPLWSNRVNPAPGLRLK